MHLSRFSSHSCGDRSRELQEVIFLWNKPSGCHLSVFGDRLPGFVDVVCADALQIICTLLELRASFDGYEVVQLNDICFLPVHWSALQDRGANNQLPRYQVC